MFSNTGLINPSDGSITCGYTHIFFCTLSNSSLCCCIIIILLLSSHHEEHSLEMEQSTYFPKTVCVILRSRFQDKCPGLNYTLTKEPTAKYPLQWRKSRILLICIFFFFFFTRFEGNGPVWRKCCFIGTRMFRREQIVFFWWLMSWLVCSSIGRILYTRRKNLCTLWVTKKNVFVLRERATVDVDPLWHLTDWLIPSAVQRQESRKQGHEHGNKATKTQEQKKKEKISSENVRENN